MTTITQQVDPTRGDAPNIMLINAMAALAGDTGDIAEIFKIDFKDRRTVDVQLIVNGVHVPFVESIRYAWKTLEASLDREVEKRAIELVSAARLDRIRQALDSAEYEIEDAVRVAMKARK